MFKVGDKVIVVGRGTARPRHHLDTAQVAEVISGPAPKTGSYEVRGTWKNSGGRDGRTMVQWVNPSELEAAP